MVYLFVCVFDVNEFLLYGCDVDGDGDYDYIYSGIGKLF